MKKLLACVLLSLLSLAGCGALQPPAPAAPLVYTPAERAEMRSVTILSGGRAVCGGVWVSQTEVLTAFHCVSEDDIPVDSVDYSDKEGTENQPFVAYSARIARYDFVHDLALLTTQGHVQPFDHEIAYLSTRVIHDGDRVDVIGATKGFSFTCLQGQVGATRPAGYRGLPFKMLQLSLAGVNHGNSGGGAFDTYGRLVGIADVMMEIGGETIQSVAFYTHRDVLRKFLDAR